MSSTMGSTELLAEESFSSDLIFFVNGQKHQLSAPALDPRMTLLTYIRRNGLTGSKLGCGEGGCGACTVMLSRAEEQTPEEKADKKLPRIQHFSVNACLVPLCSLHGISVTTIEGIGGLERGVHPIQRRVAAMHGTQCGFCTPGIVMAIYAQLRMKPDSTPEEIEASLDGNLCRCTGYRPILDAARSLSNNKGGRGCCSGAGTACPCNAVDADQETSTCCSTDSKYIHHSSESILQQELSLNEEMQMRNLTEPIFPPFLLRFQTAPLQLTGQGTTWYQPTTLPQLLALKSVYPEGKLVVGNSEVGIETKFKHAEYSVLINPSHVAALQVLTRHPTALEIGAAVSLNRLRYHIEALEKSWDVSRAYELRTLVAIKDMLHWFASNHIRNTACLAGNIVTASPISDLNPLLLACHAKLKLVSMRGERVVSMDSFFLGYRRVDIAADEVLQSVWIPFHTSPTSFMIPFKQARRREDDISIVTAGMFVQLEETVTQVWTVQDCALAFGGMAATPVLATTSMAALKGMPWNVHTTQTVLEALRQELQLPMDVPGGQVEYRMALALSFFMKAYLAVCSQLQLLVSSEETASSSGADNFLTSHKMSSRGEQRYLKRDGNLHHARPVPHAIQTASSSTSEATPEDFIVGKAMMHQSGIVHATGEAKYTWDYATTTTPPTKSSMLHASLVTSARPHAKILHIDISKAQQSPGFVAYYSANDVLGSNAFGGIYEDEEIFCTEVALYQGAVLGIVVAATHEDAVQAAKAVHITYEDLPVIITIDDAIAQNSFYDALREIRRGNVEEMKAQSDIVVQGKFRVGGQEHFYLETNASVAFPADNGLLKVIASTQNCTKTQKYCASICNLPVSKVEVVSKRVGGGFGGKESRSIFISAAVSLAAKLLQQPVSINIERDLDMSISGQRHAFIFEYEAGVTTDGQLKFLHTTLYNNAGCSIDLSSAVLERCMLHIDNCYFIPAVSMEGRVCRTNQCSHTAFRGFGAPQAMLFIETVMEHLATAGRNQAVDWDVNMLRERNFYQPALEQRTPYGQVVQHFFVPALWQDLFQTASIIQRQEDIKVFNQANRYKKRGLSVLPTKFGINFPQFLAQAGALVHVYLDGSVLVAHGGAEMGQGLHTKVIQVVSQSLSIPIEQVMISETSTSTTANTSPTAGSLGTELYGMAALDACEQLLERLKPVREKLQTTKPDTEITWLEVVNAAYFQRVNLTAQGFYTVDAKVNPDYDWFKKCEDNSERGFPFSYFTQGVACSEVEVDCLTGNVTILRSDILMDCGKSVNPGIDIGQIEGAFVQGIGLSTMEELVWGDKEHSWVKEGSLFTRGPGTYKIPAFNDIPRDFRVHLANTENPLAIHSSKAIGEPPLFLGCTVFFAIKHAIQAARQDQGYTAHYTLHSPATSERVRMACVDDIVAMCVPGGSEQAAAFQSKGTF